MSKLEKILMAENLNVFKKQTLYNQIEELVEKLDENYA